MDQDVPKLVSHLQKVQKVKNYITGATCCIGNLHTFKEVKRCNKGEQLLRVPVDVLSKRAFSFYLFIDLNGSEK